MLQIPDNIFKGGPGSGRHPEGNDNKVTTVDSAMLATIDSSKYEDCGYSHFGYRIVAADSDDYNSKIGDTLEPSHVWDNGEYTDDLQNGTACIDPKQLSSAQKYYGDRVLVIASDSREWGNDPGEMILRDAKVIDIINFTNKKFLPIKSIKLLSTEQKTKLWKKFDATASSYEPLLDDMKNTDISSQKGGNGMTLKIDLASLTFKTKTTLPQIKAFDPSLPMRVVQMSADDCKRLCDAIGLEYVPGYENRVIERITTTETPDRMGDIVRATGIDISNYRKNPVVLFAHDSRNLPVGQSLKEFITNDGVPGWKSQDVFLNNEVDPSGRSDLIYRFVKSGALKGGSIGFRPVESKWDYTPLEKETMGLGNYGVDYIKCEKLEHSCCAIPANGDALAKAMEGVDLKSFNQEDYDTMQKALYIDENLIDRFKSIVEPAPVISIGKGGAGSGKWGSADESEVAEAVETAAAAADEAKDYDTHTTAAEAHKKAHDSHKRLAGDNAGVAKDLHNDAAKLHNEAQKAHVTAADSFKKNPLANDSKEFSTVAKTCSKCAAVMSKAAFTVSAVKPEKSISVTIDAKGLAEEIVKLLPVATPAKQEPEPKKGKGIVLHKLVLNIDKKS